MASIIRIKRSTVTGNPTTLAAGELAYSALTDGGANNGGDRLYIGIGAETNGNAANHFVIGGKYFTDMLDQTPGTLTASSAIVVDANSKIDLLNVDNLTLNGNTISSTDTNGNILLDPAGSGYVQIIGTNGLVIPSGTTAQQGPALNGAVRLNTDSGQFEGYSNGNWSSLGGVRSVDGLTYITAELNPNASDDTLRFVTNGTLNMALDTTSLNVGTAIVTTLNNTTQSTSTSSGALVVAGGVGIAKNLYVGGDFNIAGSQTITGDFGINGGDLYSTATTFNLLNKAGSGSGTNDGPGTVNAFLGATAISIGASTGTTTVNNNVEVVGDLTVTGNDIKSSGGTTALTLSTADVTVQGDLTVNGNDIKSSTATALTLSGADVNVKGALDVDSTLNVDGSSTLRGATTVGQSGTRVATTVYGTAVNITGSDNSTFGVAAATASAITQVIQATNSVGDANLDVNVDDAFTLDATAVSIDSTDTSNLTMTANSSSNKTLLIDALNIGTGAAVLQVGSGQTDNTNINAATQITLTSQEVQTDVTTFDLNAQTVDITTTGTGNSITLTGLAATVNADTITLRGTEGAGDNTVLTVTGQLDIDNIRLDGNTISTTDGSNTLYLDPAPVNDNAGLVVIKGNLQVDGTTTTVNSTQVTIDDPIFTLGGDTAPTADDNLDRGIMYRYHDGTAAKLGFFGWSDLNGEFQFIADATDTNSVLTPASVGIYGNARFGKLALADTTQSTTTTSGALTVAGGVGISGQLNVAGATNKFTATTASTSTTTGALVVAGGIGMGGTMYVGTNLVGSGAATSSIDGFNIDGGTY